MGDVIEAASVENGWVRVSSGELARRKLPHTGDGWVLINGKAIGMGLLLEQCDAQGNLPVQLSISGADVSCMLTAKSLWTGRQVKAAAEKELCLPRRATAATAAMGRCRRTRHQLQLLLGARELPDRALLGPFLGGRGAAELSLALRPELQAAFLARIEDAGPGAVRELMRATVPIRTDPEMVTAAVQECGLALEHASLELRADAAVVLEAVRSDGCALQFASPGLQADRAVVLAAVRCDGSALRWAAESLRGDREVVLTAVQRYGLALKYASDQLQADRETVLAAMGTAGDVLDYTSRLWQQHAWAKEPSSARQTEEEGRAAAAPEAAAEASGGAAPEPSRPAAAYRRARVVRTVRSKGETWNEYTELKLEQQDNLAAQAPSVFVCADSLAERPWLGFGGSFTEASAIVFSSLSDAKQRDVLRSYFDAGSGLGYSLGRLHIGSCDFSAGSWACGDIQEGDMFLDGFSLERYHTAIIPMIRQAAKVAGAPLTMLASPWTPPPWMKTKKDFTGGGHLRPDCQSVWADHYVRFVQEMGRVGVPIWGVSVQNEPEAAQAWESCLFSAAEERDFVSGYLGPALEAAGHGGVKVLVWDHNRSGMLERAAVAYSDPEAAKYIWGVAYHWYGDARFESWPERSEVTFADRQRKGSALVDVRAQLGLENVRRVAELRPDKHVIQTESCQELSGRPLKDALGDFKLAERYAMNIIADMNSGCEGWIDWNLVLNEVGGPNHAGNYCVAPIICELRKDEVLLQPCYWYLGHFSRHIRPGARRAICSSSRDALEVTAFVNLDGTLAIVVLNQSEGGIHFCLKVAGAGAAPVYAPAHSILTLLVDGKEASASDGNRKKQGLACIDVELLFSSISSEIVHYP